MMRCITSTLIVVLLGLSKQAYALLHLDDTRTAPQQREMSLEDVVPAIPISVVHAFLNKPRVVGDEVLETAPYVVASMDGRLISAAGDDVYVRGLDDFSTADYSVFREGETYIDPDTGETLGYEAIFLGKGTVSALGEPATLTLHRTNREIRIGDRLLKKEGEYFELDFIPHYPDQPLSGEIISVFDGVSIAGQHQVIVLNLGQRNGLKTGHILSAYQAGRMIRDRFSVSENDTVTLPDEYAGEAIVFKTYEKVSYAILLKSRAAIRLYDKVRHDP